MGVLSQYRTDRLIQRLLSEENVNTPAGTEIVGKLRRSPGDAVPGLVGRLETASQEQFRNIAVALYKLLDDDTLEHYFEGLKSGNTRTVGAISKILATSRRFNPNRLVPLFEDADVPKSTLIQTLSQHQQRLNADLLLRYATRLEPADHNALFKVIEQIADSSLVPRLLSRATAQDASIRAHVVRLLAKFPSPEVAKTLEQSLGDDARIVRMAAVEGLAEADIQPSIGTLARLLRDPDLGIQSRAIDAVIRLGHPDTMQYLLPILQDESEYVRRAGVEVLNEVADTSLISDLLAVLRDEDWWVRERAADALARIGGPRVVDAMLQLIKSDDEFVRRTAIEVINASRDPRAYDYLIAALGDEDWWVKERAVDALAALGTDDAVPHLLRVLDEDERARSTVLRALAALGDSGVVDRVQDFLADADPQVRLEALRALESLAEESQSEAVMGRIEQAMEGASEAFRDQARGVLANIRARFASSEPTGEAAAGTAAGTATLITRPGEAPQRLPAGTRLDVAQLIPGTVLDGRYRFIERVGHGAFGTVMRFEDTTVGEEIILKFLNENVSEDERVAKRFVQELRYARRVTHPNVIRIFDFLRIGGLYAISMEYFPGFPLTRELLQNQPMRTDRALRLLREITFGMAAAHRSGVVHRDLKPANILMSHVDQVKIVDFGIAAAAFRDPEDTEITQTGDFVGTPAYTSPEQVRGQAVDQRTDIYSLGVVMYRMFAGRLPYQDKERRNLLLRHLEGRPPALGELNAELPEQIPRIVAKAMAVDPNERYASMTDLRQDLEEFVR
jgi:serine/threonine-protein kinase